MIADLTEDVAPFRPDTPAASEARRANDELATRRIMCRFCLDGMCMPTWPADRWVRLADGRVLPACRIHSDEGENVPFDDGCREFIARKILES